MKRGRGRPRKELDWKALAAEYQAGATLAALSEKYAVSYPCLRKNIAPLAAIKKCRIDWPAVIVAYATESAVSIARKVGTYPHVISHGLRKRGVPVIERRGRPRATPQQIESGLAEGRQLREAMLKAGISQCGMADRLGVTHQAISLALCKGGSPRLRARIAAELRKADLGR